MTRNRTRYNLNHLQNLVNLYVDDTEISDDSISNLIRLEHLRIVGCRSIKNLNSLVSLTTLVANETNLTNEGIMNLTNLTELNLDDVSGITDLNHLTKLKILSIRGESGVDNNGIKNLVLDEMYADCNKNISTEIVLDNMFAKFLDIGKTMTREEFDQMIKRYYELNHKEKMFSK
jgi:hypothetical protein